MDAAGGAGGWYGACSCEAHPHELTSVGALASDRTLTRPHASHPAGGTRQNRRREMRARRGVLTATVAMALVATLLAVPAARAIEQAFPINREGQVVAIGDTTITIHEDAGEYTYSLAPMGRVSLEAAHIQPGDWVRYTVYSPWGYAHDFTKFSKK